MEFKFVAIRNKASISIVSTGLYKLNICAIAKGIDPFTREAWFS